MEHETPDLLTASSISNDGKGCACGRDKILVALVLMLAGGGIAGLQLLRGPCDVAQAGPAATAPVKALDIAQLRGIALQLQADDNHPFDKYIKEIAATGANSICMVVSGMFQNCGSSSIYIDARKTPSLKRMKELINLAHEQGLKVVLMPIILPSRPREDEWRGKIDPTKDKNSWDDWWEDYTNYIMYWAYLAGEAKVDVFMVGSELVSVEPQTERWVKLIEQVRGAYGGLLSYSSNWDHYKPIKFWDKLDIVGMTTYYDLCGDKQPTLEVMLASWKQIKKDLLEWQASVNRPILFTEVGWPNQETAAKYPWDYYRATDKPAPELQKQCFESFFKTWADEEGMAGYVVWEWRNWDMPTDPKRDTTFCPVDKPALDVIREYLVRKNGLVTDRKTASKPASGPAGEAGKGMAKANGDEIEGSRQ